MLHLKQLIIPAGCHHGAKSEFIKWSKIALIGVFQDKERGVCQFQFFIIKDTGALHKDTLDIFDKVANKVQQEGIEAWYELDEKSLLGDDYESYDKSHDSLDVWFDSGVTHDFVLKENEDLQWPADLYLEGSDQHRGWFGSSLLTSAALYKRAPYKQVVTHGFVVDADGKKCQNL